MLSIVIIVLNDMQIFLVDNGTSMYHHWGEAGFVLETLVMKLAGIDDDGLDLRFTIGRYSVNDAKGSKTASKFRNAMREAEPAQTPQTKTNMAESLGRVFNEYLQSRKGKNLTLLVLTDGIWEGSVKEKSVEMKIVECITALRHRHQSMEDRPYTIQFIRFGNDAEAISRLDDLDNNIGENYGIP